MEAKILLCVALCFTLTQVSLARPDQGYYFYGQEVEETNDKPDACHESLQKAQQQLQEMIALSDKVKADIQQVFLKGKDCLKRKDMIKCVQDIAKESVGNFWANESKFRSIIKELIASIAKAMKSCLGQGSMLLIQTLVPLGIEYVL